MRTTHLHQPSADVLSQALRAAAPERRRRSFFGVFAMAFVVLSVVFIVGNVLVMWLWFDDPTTGLGVGVMSAVWGGPGFGVMIAGALRSGQLDEPGAGGGR